MVLVCLFVLLGEAQLVASGSSLASGSARGVRYEGNTTPKNQRLCASPITPGGKAFISPGNVTLVEGVPFRCDDGKWVMARQCVLTRGPVRWLVDDGSKATVDGISKSCENGSWTIAMADTAGESAPEGTLVSADTSPVFTSSTQRNGWNWARNLGALGVAIVVVVLLFRQSRASLRNGLAHEHVTRSKPQRTKAVKPNSGSFENLANEARRVSETKGQVKCRCGLVLRPPQTAQDKQLRCPRCGFIFKGTDLPSDQVKSSGESRPKPQSLRERFGDDLVTIFRAHWRTSDPTEDQVRRSLERLFGQLLWASLSQSLISKELSNQLFPVAETLAVPGELVAVGGSTEAVVGEGQKSRIRARLAAVERHLEPAALKSVSNAVHQAMKADAKQHQRSAEDRLRKERQRAAGDHDFIEGQRQAAESRMKAEGKAEAGRERSDAPQPVRNASRSSDGSNLAPDHLRMKQRIQALISELDEISISEIQLVMLRPHEVDALFARFKAVAMKALTRMSQDYEDRSFTGLMPHQIDREWEVFQRRVNQGPILKM